VTSIWIYISLLFNPRKAFEWALSRKVWTLVFPLIATITLTALVNVYYYYVVDLPWLIGQIASTLPEGRGENFLDSFTKNRLLSMSLVGIVFLTLTISLYRSFVYWIIFKVRGNAPRFVRLYAIAIWSTAPVILLFCAGIINISLGGNILPIDVNPVSLNQMIFRFDGTSDWGRMLSTFSLINVWEIFLIGIGLNIAAKSTVVKSYIIAIIPEILVYSVWLSLLILS